MFGNPDRFSEILFREAWVEYFAAVVGEKRWLSVVGRGCSAVKEEDFHGDD